ncbi:MAG TPA: D-arabinono-1,4-lactone oxidase, partial [Stackebrandtia sp.]|uniref:D-arabinono-1,4-lactone oxidase n=1 Tax=Stackebrandtia sp. TaxID=2023065 RepID=UPI002D2E5593
AVRAAADSGGRVKALGAGHSFTAISAGDDTVLRLDAHRPAPQINADTGEVTIGAGTPLHELNPLLASHGLAMPNLGDIDVQTIAGAISTGTHGTGAALGGLATFVSGVTLIDGTGTERRYTRDDPELGAAALGLGALGILTDVTIQCVPAFRLHADEHPMPLDTVINDFDALAADNDHFEFYWFPRATRALVKRNNRIGEAGPLSGFRRWLDDDLMSNSVYGLMCRLGKAVPPMVPAITAISARAMSARTFKDDSYRVFCSPRRVRFVEMEYALPRDAFAPAFAALRAEANARRVVFPVEVRVAAADDVWMSTSNGRDTVYFAVHQYKGMPYRDYFDAVEAIMRSHDGRPHWGKLHTRTAADLAPTYARFAEFRALRDRLDPERVFANPYLTQVLGD